MNEPLTLTIQDWTFSIRPPSGPAARAVLLAIHGRTGNEASMEIFIQKLNRIFWVISPRAPFPAQGGGYTWEQEDKGIHVDFPSLESSAIGLNGRISFLTLTRGIADLPVHLLGFSQGAALALTYSLRYSRPSLYEKIGLLSGFLPEGNVAEPGSLAGLSYFVSHGRKDPTVPIEQAGKVVQFLETSGALVDYCESDSGHKLSMECFKRMEAFFFDS